MSDLLKEIESLEDGKAKELLDTLLHRFEYVAVNRKVFYGNDQPQITAMKAWCLCNSYVPLEIEEWEYLKARDKQLSDIQAEEELDQLIAAENTMKAVENRYQNEDTSFSSKPGLSLQHLRDMLRKMQTEGFSEAKMGRWLGWMQAVAVSSTLMTLEEFKVINKDSKREKPDS